MNKPLIQYIREESQCNYADIHDYLKDMSQCDAELQNKYLWELFEYILGQEQTEIDQ